MKKILILYATAGSGHKKAAEAIERASKRLGLKPELADIVSFMPRMIAKLYSDGYIFTIKNLPLFWGILYFLSDTPVLAFINVGLRRFLDRLSCFNLTNYLLEKKPDVVISTQFLASEIVSYAKLKHGLKTKLITVITDFGVHNFWISPETDIYCCASEYTKNILLKKGVPVEKIRVTGIPLDEKFLNVGDKKSVAGELDLKEGMFTVLIMTGGIGAGPIEKIVELLKDDAQLLVICGHNKRLYQQLSSKKYPNVRAFEFIDYVEKLMRVSDMIVTKAGGLSVCESMNMGLPAVFFFLIPGQETLNASAVSSQHAGFIAKNPNHIKEIVTGLKNNPASLSALKETAFSIAKPNSSEHIASLVNQ